MSCDHGNLAAVTVLANAHHKALNSSLPWLFSCLPGATVREGSPLSRLVPRHVAKFQGMCLGTSLAQGPSSLGVTAHLIQHSTLCRILRLGSDSAPPTPRSNLAPPPTTLWDSGLRCKSMSFSYPGRGSSRPAICRVSLTFPVGTSTALVGRSGSGKSTLALLLARVLVPNDGQVLLGDVDLQMLDRDWYQQGLAMVPQVRSLPVSCKQWAK
jgi:ABC-type multidrug transport system fused ATPase/permease subunit